MARQARQPSGRRTRLLWSAYACWSWPRSGLAGGAEATTAGVYDGSDPASITKVLTALIPNF
jgi:hypothetical protein